MCRMESEPRSTAEWPATMRSTMRGLKAVNKLSAGVPMRRQMLNRASREFI
jgi:hypothetical protein